MTVYGPNLLISENQNEPKDPQSALEIKSSKGFLPPRLSQAEIDSLKSGLTDTDQHRGMIVVNKDENQVLRWDGVDFVELGSGAGGDGYNANPDPYFQDDAWAPEGSETGITWTVDTEDESIGGPRFPGTATIAKDASDREGQGRKVVIDVAGEARARGFYTIRKTYSSATGLSSGAWRLECKDQNGDTLSVQGLANGGDLPGVSDTGLQRIACKVLLNNDTTELHYAIVASDTTDATSITYHGPFLGKGQLLNGSRAGYLGDKYQFSSNWSGAFSTEAWRTENDSLTARVLGDLDATPSGTFDLTLPSGLSIAIQDTTSLGTVVGSGYVRPQGGTGRYPVDVIYHNDSTLRLNYHDENSGVVRGLLVSNAGPIAWNSSGFMELLIHDLPIAEWAAEPRDVLSAAELMNVTATFHTEGQTAQTITGTNTTQIIFRDSAANFSDPQGRYNPSTGGWAAPTTGYYLVASAVSFAKAAGQRARIRIRVGTNSFTSKRYLFNSTAAEGDSIVGLVYAEKDEAINIAVENQSGATDISMENAAAGSHFSIHAVPDLSIISQIANPFEVLSATSSEKSSISSNTYMQMTGNSLVLTPGVWQLFGSVSVGESGGNPGYTRLIADWRGANGDDSNTEPATVDSLAGLTVLSAANTDRRFYLREVSMRGASVPVSDLLVRVTQPTTIYMVPYCTITTPANARVFTHINARRIA